MERTTIETTKHWRVEDLKDMANVQPPCLTITIPLQHADNTAWMDHQRLKSAAQSVEPALADLGLQPRAIREFLDPITHMNGESWGHGFGSLVVLRSPEIFRYIPIRTELKNAIVLERNFHVLSFLAALQNQHKRFYIMALSQHHARLIRCTDQSCEEVPLGEGVPASLEQWLNTRTPADSPDHGRKRTSEDGPAGAFNGSTDIDNLDRHIRNFFKKVSESVDAVLRQETDPLILAGVEYEVSMWRDIATYPHLAEGHVQGSPDGLRGPELHARASEIAKVALEAPMNKALQFFERLGGSERASTDAAEIVKAAHEARVAHLFVAEGASYQGGWNREAMKATSKGSEDLLNMAALQTLVNGGEVWITNPENVPGGGFAAALFRF